MNILIAGGCGFVGTNLAIFFSEKGHDVCCVDDLSRKGVESNAAILENMGLSVIRKTVQERDFGGMHPDVILNASAQSSATKGMLDPLIDFYANLETVAILLEEARKHESLFIQWSTNKVYSAEIINSFNSMELSTRYDVYWTCRDLSLSEKTGSRSVYGATKRAAEALIEEWSKAFKIRCIVNRCSCLAGPYQLGCADQGWVAAWVLHHMLGKPLSYIGWKGKQVRDILHVDDLCRLVDLQIASCVNSLISYRVFNVGGGIENTVSLLEATELCREITGKRLHIDTIAEPRWADHRVYVSDITKVCTEFNWLPILSNPRSVFEDIYGWSNVHMREISRLYI